jgi:hypothetical protein
MVLTNSPSNNGPAVVRDAMHGQPLVAPTTQYAVPIARMWQTPTEGWLDAHRKAAEEDKAIGDHKKLVAESKVMQRGGVTIILWLKVSSLVCHVNNNILMVMYT